MEHFVKGDLERPTLVMDLPIGTRPLAREHRSIAGVVEKWDLYVRGFELATGYSELVDPVIQRERLVEQAKLAARGDAEAMLIDEEFLRALEYGDAADRRYGDGYRPAAHRDHRAWHPRHNPLSTRQVERTPAPRARRMVDVCVLDAGERGWRSRHGADPALRTSGRAHHSHSCQSGKFAGTESWSGLEITKPRGVHLSRDDNLADAVARFH